MRVPYLGLLVSCALSIPVLAADNQTTAARETAKQGADMAAGAEAATRKAPAGEKRPAAPAIRKGRIRQSFPPSSKRM